MKTFEKIVTVVVLVLFVYMVWWSYRLFKEPPIEKIDISPTYELPEYDNYGKG